MNMEWVRWSDLKDKEDRPMIQIGGGHYTVEVAKVILSQLQQILDSKQVSED